MIETAHQWEPVEGIPNITDPFGGIAFAHEAGNERPLSVVMYGHQNLRLRFTGTIAIRFEDDCPGFDPLPKPLPMIRPGITFPLLQIDDSKWLGQWKLIHTGSKLCHFALLSLDDLVQIIAKSDVAARWD